MSVRLQGALTITWTAIVLTENLISKAILVTIWSHVVPNIDLLYFYKNILEPKSVLINLQVHV